MPYDAMLEMHIFLRVPVLTDLYLIFLTIILLPFIALYCNSVIQAAVVLVIFFAS